ncbi:hypothetical protein SERLADRAFT_436907 [Serpula lacrymans var. lacrymans S7.9]|uniref:Uncharacterized protein n=1 Tax=Serpula lacrymans var. lacrymans (strain S7.9) TaxID=578457 RepID=F8NU72_SERL9|nr:uncharacterized protein SERLADRAFT_436907 [Serpula lacrymans var. lacrymans S7.9]EGO25146.1 hypothetical protein SERLADRAFT_436907 [Serpula lacrymans var. lacrymans S7.9]
MAETDDGKAAHGFNLTVDYGTPLDTQEMLDIEDDEERERRIGNLLERLNTSPHSTTPRSEPPLSFDFGERKTFQVDPPDELLARIKDFLPRLEAENAILAQRAQADPESVDIENVEDSDRYIEMNLGLGVFEDRSKRPGESETQSSSSEEDGTSDTSSTSTSSSSSDEELSDSSSDEDDNASSRPVKPLPSRTTRRPHIEVLQDTTTGS